MDAVPGGWAWAPLVHAFALLGTYAAQLVVGVVAGLVALGATRVGQWWIDHKVKWPFRTRVVATSNPAFPRYRARIRVFNRASTTAHVNLTPRDSRDAVVNGWLVKDPWGYRDAGLLASVRPREWAEFWLEGPNAPAGDPPTQIHFEAWFFTDEQPRSRLFEISYGT